MSNIDSRVERAKRRLFARIIACAHLLDKPFSDAPDQSPWTRLKADMTALDEALKQQAPDVVETIAVVEREEKQARDLKRGDWIAPWYPAKVLYAEPYIERGRERVLVVYRDPYYLQPEVDRYDGNLRVTMANPDEIPEDPAASGRELADEPGGVPACDEGHRMTGRA